MTLGYFYGLIVVAFYLHQAVCWVPPPHGVVNINFDESGRDDGDAVGYVLIDHLGYLLVAAPEIFMQICSYGRIPCCLGGLQVGDVRQP